MYDKIPKYKFIPLPLQLANNARDPDRRIPRRDIQLRPHIHDWRALRNDVSRKEVSLQFLFYIFTIQYHSYQNYCFI